MTMILIKDTLRKQVEAASGGLQTILYTAKGQPSFVNIVPKVDLSAFAGGALGSGTHPAFIVNDAEIPEIYIGTYQGVVIDGELISQPYATPTYNNSPATYMSAAAAAGSGWHVLSYAEWALLMHQVFTSKQFPHGNNAFGYYFQDMSEYGVRTDGQDITVGQTADGQNFGGVTLTGSGPVNWRHDLSFAGIADIVGNLNELTVGVRLSADEFQIMRNNNAAAVGADLSDTSALWMAIDGASGDLITPTFTGTLGGSDQVITTPRSVRFSTVATGNDYTVYAPSNSLFAAMTNNGNTPVSAAALTVLKKAGLYPMATTVADAGPGIIYATGALTGLRRIERGGHLGSKSNMGINTMEMSVPAVSTPRGARPVYYTPLA